LPHPALTIYDNRVQEIINIDFSLETLDDSAVFTEGPVWSKDGFYLFSDIPRNVIYKIRPGSAKEIYVQESGYSYRDKALLSDQIGSNGLAFDHKGELLICQHGNGAIARWDGNKVEHVIRGYQSRPFNSPNDIVTHSNGTIFFSDPPYGLKDTALQPQFFQPVAGIYSCRQGEVKLLSTHYQYPNGLCLSPDEQSLFTCSNKPFEASILEFDALTLRLKRKVAGESSDGIKCDKRGNLYLCTKEGIVVIDQEGKRLAKISLEAVPANACWGGEGANDLFITARQHIFLIRDLQKS
jgi:gluconolactonase